MILEFRPNEFLTGAQLHQKVGPEVAHGSAGGFLFAFLLGFEERYVY